MLVSRILVKYDTMCWSTTLVHTEIFQELIHELKGQQNDYY